jgi:hypothetical protein
VILNTPCLWPLYLITGTTVWIVTYGSIHTHAYAPKKIAYVFPGVTGPVRLATSLPGQTYLLISGNEEFLYDYERGDTFVKSTQDRDIIISKIIRPLFVSAVAMTMNEDGLFALAANGTRYYAHWSNKRWNLENDYFNEKVDFAFIY